MNVVACVLAKVGKPNWGSGKHKGASRDFRKKTRFKLKENQIATNRRSEATHFVSSETQEHLFRTLILCCKFIFILIVVIVIQFLLPSCDIWHR